MSLRAGHIMWILVGIAALLFLPFLGSVHLFDWDEINFAECAREMLETGDIGVVQINYLPFWEKPPLFIWMQAVSMWLFGVGEYAARFPNAICGIITLVSLFTIGKTIRDKKLGLLWAAFYGGSVLPHFYFKTGIIDPWFNFFIIMAVWQLVLYTLPRHRSKRKSRYALLAGVYIGAAVLTKGPVALLLMGGAYFIFLVLKKFKGFMKIHHILYALVGLGVIGGSWFMFLLATGHQDVIHDFIDYQVRLSNTGDAGHGRPFYYHFFVLLIGCFPASAFAIYGHRRFPTAGVGMQHTQLWMVILFWLVLIIFSIVKTKIVHYSSMCYFPLTFLAAYAVYGLIDSKKKLPGWITSFQLVSGLILAVATAGLVYIGFNKDAIDPESIVDLYTRYAWLQNVSFCYWHYTPAAILVLGLLTWMMFFRHNNFRGVFVLLISVALFTNIGAVMLAPKIEAHTQKKVIEFYESVQGQDDIIIPYGFKTYAHLFYSRKGPEEVILPPNEQEIKTMPVKEPVYFVLRRNQQTGFEEKYPDFILLKDCGGLLVYHNPNQ